MAKVQTQKYRYDIEAWSATSYDDPVGYVEPGDVRELPSAPDFHWSLVEDAPAKPAPAPIAIREPEASDTAAPVEADADPATEEK